jgi:hypothetical protein
MIVCNLYGGLGNQMFQYAFGKSHAERTGEDIYFSTDFSTDKSNFFKAAFNLENNFLNSRDLNQLFGPIYANKYLRKSLGKFNNLPFSPKNFFFEKNYAFDPNFFNLEATDIKYFQGYWQSFKYFKGMEDLIRRDFKFFNTFSCIPISEKIEKVKSVAIHIRRGDYLSVQKNKSIYNVCSKDYYYQAIDILSERFENLQFFVFSDDKKWAFDNICSLYKNSHLVDLNNYSDSSYLDMFLISKCENQIIANSTFSWWGAWLNSNENKIVISPEAWYLNGNTTNDLLPYDWIRL